MTGRDPSEPRNGALGVLIADADPLARLAISSVLAGAEGVECAGEVASGADTVALVEADPPGAVVMDAALPGAPDCIAATRRIAELDASVQVVVLSAENGDEERSLLALRAGAAGWLPKDMDLTVLPRVLRKVCEGEAAIPRTLTARLVERLREAPVTGAGLRPVRSDLTSREWEVLDTMCAGLPNEAIATRLEVSAETVRSHIKHIFRKLGVHTRPEAIAAAERLRTPTPTGIGTQPTPVVW